MDTESVHPYTWLTPDAVIDAVETTGRLSDARILALNSYENRVYQVGIEDGEPIIAKFYRPGRWTDEQILEEHAYTQYLYDLDIPVVPPLVENDSTLFRFEVSSGVEFRFSLYPRQGGRAPELDNLEHLYQIGQFIGRIHAASDGFVFKHRIALSKQQFANDSVEFLLANDFIPADLEESYRAISDNLLGMLDSTDLSSYEAISLHGDCHPGNILWRDDRPHFVDFDDAMSGPAIQDLWMLVSGEKNEQRLQWEEIIEGYEVFRRFDLRELGLIEPLRCLRVLNYNAWLAKRWDDPAFVQSFPWFNSARYWSEHILELKELLSALQEPALEMVKY